MMEELAIEDEFTNLAANSAQTKHQRMEPVGASSTLYNSHSLFSDTAVTNNTTTAVSSSSPSESGIFNDSMSRMHMLEQEHEQLSSSLMSLTTHFAQVQFRLKQVVAAADEDKDRLLRELEEFAFRGCPNMSNSVSMASAVQDQIIEEQRAKQKDLIEQLKAQLQDLEIYAYQTGDSELPSSVVMEKHKLILDELRDKLNLPVDDFNKLSNDEIKQSVQSAIGEIVNPIKVKEQLVTQLKTQIEDLERFIDFLQGEASSPGPYIHKKNAASGESNTFSFGHQQSKSASNKASNYERMAQTNESTIELLKKVLSVMQIYAITQLGCGVNSLEKNTLKKSSNHWGDLRANLELSINKVLRCHANILETLRKNKLKLNSTATESDEELAECPHELIRVVRKDLACALRDLLQHGLVEVTHGTSMVPFGCFVVRSSKGNPNQMHAWSLLAKYYEMKHGKEFTQSATNKLSQSFSLNVIAGKTITIKQSLLNAIDTIYKVHKYDMSDKDSCFKAFVCLAINEKKLVLYLKQVLKTTIIVENYYQTWSYVKTTGFDDALKALDQLKVLCSTFPVDKSVRRKSANNAKDLF